MFGVKTGVGYYMWNLVHHLIMVDSTNDYYLYTAASARSGEDHKITLPANARIVDIRMTNVFRPYVGWRARRDRLDLFHGTNGRIMTRGRFGAVATVQDLVWLRFPKPQQGRMGMRKQMARARRLFNGSTKLIAASQNTANDLAELFEIPREKIVIIYDGVNPGFGQFEDRTTVPASTPDSLHRAAPYILYVGGFDQRKNVLSLIKAYSLLPDLHPFFSLVLVGGDGEETAAIKALAVRLGLERHVVFTGYLPVEALKRFYTGATVFVYPSLYEGFGLPPLEAMACGTPVVTSNTSSLPEVVGNAGRLVAPTDVEGFAAAIRNVIEDEALRRRMRERGLERAQHFSWDATARQTLALYRELCGQA